MNSGHTIAMALRAAYLAMHRQAERSLQPYGVTANQFVVLWVLAEQDGISQRILVERTASDANTIRPVLASLEKKKYIVRELHPTDRRAWCVRLTKTGRSAFAKMRTGTEAFRRELTEPFTASDASALVQLLQQLTASLQRQNAQESSRGRRHNPDAASSTSH